MAVTPYHHHSLEVAFVKLNKLSATASRLCQERCWTAGGILSGSGWFAKGKQQKEVIFSKGVFINPGVSCKRAASVI